jgi:sterol 3beta-glucosyltransferase
MHYAIIAYGSRGDVQPFVALALGLMKKGHRVTLLANKNFKTFVEDYGVGFYPLYGNVEEMVSSPQLRAVLKSGSAISYMREFRKMTKKDQPMVNDDMRKGCAEADVLVATPLTVIWVYSVAEKLGKPWVIIQLSVPAIPTTEFPFASLDFFNFPRYNLFTYRLIRHIYWRLNKNDINQHRSSLYLPPLAGSILNKIDGQKIPTLYAISSGLFPRPKDWNEQVDITGFIFLRNAPKRTAANNNGIGLEAWLKKGTPPVYVGFGSIPIPDNDLFARILSEIIDTTTYRIIFCRGWSKIPDLPKSDRLFTLNSANHAWLLRQCMTAIFHGGVGTLAAVLEANIPPIIVSIFADQPLLGKIIASKGLGVHIPFKKLTSEKLIDAIAKVGSPDIKQNVALLNERIKAENGLEKAIDILEKHFG